MARIIIRCKYTGNYVFTAINTDKAPAVTGGCVSCPYCGTEHIWTCEQPRRVEDPRKTPPKAIVRQAS